MNNSALRAAMVVSGLTLGCGSTASSTPSTATTTATTAATSTATSTATNEVCDNSLETLSESCCAQSPGRAWEASVARCLFTSVPGPFVPPAMVALMGRILSEDFVLGWINPGGIFSQRQARTNQNQGAF